MSVTTLLFRQRKIYVVVEETRHDFGFSTALMRKDIGLVLEEASSMGVLLPVTALVGQFLADVDAMGEPLGTGAA